MLKLFKRTINCYFINVYDEGLKLTVYRALGGLFSTKQARVTTASDDIRIIIRSTKTKEQLLKYLNDNFGNVACINANGHIIEIKQKEGI